MVARGEVCGSLQGVVRVEMPGPGSEARNDRLAGCGDKVRVDIEQQWTARFAWPRSEARGRARRLPSTLACLRWRLQP